MERVRYVGEPVAIVIARDRYIAEDAIGLIETDYSPLPPAIDQEEATKDDAPVVHEAAGSNVVSTREFSYGEPEKAFAEADKIVNVKIRYPRNSQTPLEGFVVNAEYIAGEDLYDVASNYQARLLLIL